LTSRQLFWCGLLDPGLCGSNCIPALDDPVQQGARSFLICFIPVTIILTPLGQYSQLYFGTTTVCFIVGIMYLAFYSRQVYEARHIIKAWVRSPTCARTNDVSVSAAAAENKAHDVIILAKLDLFPGFS